MRNALFRLIFLACFSFSGCFCYGQTKEIDTSQMRILRIDPSSAVGAPAGQVFSEVDFIPLETTKESLFGDIHQLKFEENRFIVFDYDTRSIYIFDKDGKFISKINKKKLPAEKESEQNIYGFYIKETDQKKVIGIWGAKATVYFDLDGNFLKKETHDAEENQKKLLDDKGNSFAVNYLDKKDKDSTYYELAFFKGKDELNKYLPFTTDRWKKDQFFSAGGENPSFSGLKSEFFYVRSYDYNIYQGKVNQLSLVYRLIFPMNRSLPKDFLTNTQWKNKRMDYFQSHNQEIYALSNIYKTRDLLFFKTNSWNSDNKNSFCYNLITGDLTSVNDIEPDQLTQFLPINDAGFGYSFRNRGFLLYQDSCFYTSCSSLAMFKFKEQSADKKPVYNATMTNYFKTQNVKSNPVIIKLKPKTN